MKISKKKIVITCFILAVLLFSIQILATPFSKTNANILEKKETLLSNPELSQIASKGEPVIITGYLEITYKENFETNEFIIENYLQNENARYKVYFETGIDLPSSGSEITLEGFILNDDIAVTGFTVIPEDSLRAITPPISIGEQRLLLVLVNLQGNISTPITSEEAYNRALNESNPESIASWVRTASFGRAWLTGSVIDWVTINRTISQVCDTGSMRQAVFPLIDPQVDFRNYDRIMFVIPADYTCPYAGLGTIGASRVTTQDGQVYLTYTLINGVHNIHDGTGIHELGHNLGLFHAGDFECGHNTISETGCTSITYGDEFDVMGTTIKKGHPNAKHLETLNWINVSNVQTVRVGESGTYRIEPLETSGEGIKTVKLLLPDNSWIYIEYRRPIGYDQIAYDSLGPEIFNGALLHLSKYSLGVDTHLLDNTPHTDSELHQILDSRLTALGVGQTFNEPSSEVTVTVTDITEEYVEVFVSVPFLCGNNQLNYGEQCDGNVFAVSGCSDLTASGSQGPVTYDGGTLSCSSTCHYDSRQCTIRESCPWDQSGDGTVTPGDRGFVSTQIGCAVGTGNPICDLADVNNDGFVTPGDRGFISANLGLCPA